MELEVYCERHIIDLQSQPTEVTVELKMRARKVEAANCRIPNYIGQHQFSLFIEHPYRATWENNGVIFQDCKRMLDYGRVPFSLDTYLEWWKDPRIRHFIVDGDSIKWEADQWTNVGSMTVQTTAKGNPFVLPVRTNERIPRTVLVRMKREKLNHGGLVCSGRLVSETSLGSDFTCTFEVDRNVDSSQICLYFHRDMHFYRLPLKQSASITFLTKQTIDNSFLYDLKAAISKIRRFYVPRDILIVIGENTRLAEVEGIVFLNSGQEWNIEQRLLKSWLRLNWKDEWLVHGLATYTEDIAVQFRNITRLAELIRQGCEIAPLRDSSNCEDEVWQLRATVVMAAIANVCDKPSFMEFAMQLPKEVIYTRTFVRHIKRECGLESLDNVIKQFVDSTGLPKLLYRYVQRRNSKDVRLLVTQTALQTEYLQYYNFTRIRLERQLSIDGALTQYMQQKYEQTNDKRDEEWPSKQSQLDRWLLVPDSLRSFNFYSRKVDAVFVQHAFEVGKSEEMFTYAITRKTQTKRTLKRQQSLDAHNSHIFQISPLTWMKVDQNWKMPSIVVSGASDTYKLSHKIANESNEKELIRLLGEARRPDVTKEVVLAVIETLGRNDVAEAVRRQALRTLPSFLTIGICEEEVLAELYKQALLLQARHQTGNRSHYEFDIDLLRTLRQVKQDERKELPLEPLHKQLLSIAKGDAVWQSRSREIEWRSELLLALLGWTTRCSIEVVRYLSDYLQSCEAQFYSLFPIVRRVLPGLRRYINGLSTRNPSVVQLSQLVSKLTEMDGTGVLELDKLFEELAQAETTRSRSDFIVELFSAVESIRNRFPLLEAEALRQAFLLLSNSRQRYAFEYQVEESNNRNYILAGYFWSKLTDQQAAASATRFFWMKIYRLFYFYFTPACVLVKIREAKDGSKKQQSRSSRMQLQKNEIEQILRSIKDFAADIQWLSPQFAHVLNSQRKPRKKKQKTQARPEVGAAQTNPLQTAQSNDSEDEEHNNRPKATREPKEHSRSHEEKEHVFKLSNGEEAFLEDQSDGQQNYI